MFKKPYDEPFLFTVIDDDKVQDVIDTIQKEYEDWFGEAIVHKCTEEDKYGFFNHDTDYKLNNPLGDIYRIHCEDGGDNWNVFLEFIDIKLNSYKDDYDESVSYHDRSLMWKKTKP